MARIILIACSAKKLEVAAPARELYQGTRFKLALSRAEELEPDFCFILSAKYGFLELEEVIDPYDESLAEKTPLEQAEWALEIAGALKRRVPDEGHNIIIFAEDAYAIPLRPHFPYAFFPLTGLTEEAQKKHLLN